MKTAGAYCWIIMLLFAAKQGWSSASCCGVGGVQGGAASGVPHNILRVSANGTANGSNGKVSGTQNVNDPQNTVLKTQALTLAVGYGVTEKFSLELTGAVQWAQRSIDFPHPVVPEVRVSRKKTDFGLGDGTVAVRYSFFRYTVTRPGELTFGLQSSLPWGSTDHKQNGIRLRREMQAGTGVWALTGSGYFDWWWPQVQMGAIATINGTVNIQSSDSLDLGETISGSITAVGGPFGPVRVKGGTAFELAYPDLEMKIGDQRLRENGSTGGTKITAMGGIDVTILDPLSVSASLELPVWQNLNGTQTSTGYTISLGAVFDIGVGLDNEFGSINLDSIIDHTGHDHRDEKETSETDERNHHHGKECDHGHDHMDHQGHDH